MENSKKQAINLFNNKKYKESLSIFLSILKKKPDSIDALMFAVYNYMQLQNYKEAIINLEKIIQINNKLPDVYYNIAVCFNVLGRTEEAISNFKKAISIKKDYFESYIQLGQLLKKQNLFNDAIDFYKEALMQVKQKDSINVNISEMYYLIKNYEKSKKYAKDALKLNPKIFFAHINIANCLIDEEDIEGAVIELEKAKSINSKYPMIYNNLGFCFKILGNNEKAISNYQKAIALNPNLHDAYFNLSHIQLSMNNFKDGWKNYEYRWGTQKKFTHRLIFNKPQWDENMGFEKILIWGEQGIGEQLLFSSILHDAIIRFKKVIISVEDKLVELLQNRFDDVEIHPLSKKISEKEFDYHLPICSLARFFRKDIFSFPDKNLNNQEKKNLRENSKKKLKCALSWKSINQNLAGIKSIQLEDLKHLLLVNKIDFFNIQYTNEYKEIDDFNRKYNVQINKNNGLDTLNDLLELSKFIDKCDFVITVSNSNAHLSALMGKPTYLLLPKTRGKFWYWENDKDGRNLWYPSIVKFQQSDQGDWSKPINSLKNFICKKYDLN